MCAAQLGRTQHHDPGDAVAALSALHDAEVAKKHVTGLLYFDANKPTAAEDQNLVSIPLADLSDEQMRPSKEALDNLNAGFLQS